MKEERKKKVLILTVTAGNGHNAIAKAIKTECEEAGMQVKVVDALKDLDAPKKYIWVNDKGYALAVTYLCGVYNFFWRQYTKANPKKWNKNTVQKGPMKLYGKFLKLVYDYQPDVVFCAHYIPAMMLTNLRKIYPLPAKVIALLTDYCVQPFWECATGVDKIIVLQDKFKKQLLEKGFRDEQMLVAGMPISQKFSVKIDKVEAKKMLGIDENKFTIFVMFGGGMWSGNYQIAKTIIKNIKRNDVQLVIANGKDEKSKNKIDNLVKRAGESALKVFNWGFCSNVDVILSGADVLVGKAGGISTTEALNKECPVLACKKLPEQEKRNMKMLKEAGAGLQFNSSKELVKILNDLINNPEKAEKLKAGARNIRKLNGTKDALALIEECPLVTYENTDVNFSLIEKNIKKMLKNPQKTQKM